MGIFDKLITRKVDANSAESSLEVYSSLTVEQKLAAMNLMTVLGGSCDGSSSQISKINNIMTENSKNLGLTLGQFNLSRQRFTSLESMLEVLKTVDNKPAMDALLVQFFRIIAVNRSTEGGLFLMGIYEKLGYTEDQFTKVLENVKKQ